MDKEAIRQYYMNSAYVWHNLMGGGGKEAFEKMTEGGLVDHYLQNDKGFVEFLKAEDPMDKLQIIKSSRKGNGFAYAGSDDEIMNRMHNHGLI